MKNLAFIQFQKVEIFDSDRKKNQFNSKQIIQILQPIIDVFSTHIYKLIYFIIFLFIFYMTQFKATISLPPGVSALDVSASSM